ncbi:MAG: universal stress protein [Pseudohongiellaceae bacterium]
MKYERIVVAIDLSAESEKILNIASSIAADDCSSVHVIHVIEPMPIYPYEAYIPDMQNVHEQISAESKRQLSEFAERVNIPPSNQKVILGPPASEICQYAEDSDAQLIILGSHGVSGWRVLLGSTANRVVQEAKCDVLTVRVGLSKQE